MLKIARLYGFRYVKEKQNFCLICVLFQVYCVEEEMRQLLQEMADNKKAMENKIRRLTHALNDIQQDL